LPGRTYRFYTDTDKVVYPFGTGLSYTSFAYSELSVADDRSTVTVTVTNTGAVAGAETILMFVAAPGAGSNGAPIKSLKGFAKHYLEPNASVEVTMQLANGALRNPNEDGEWEIPSGTYTVTIGVGDNVATTTLEVE